MNNSYVYKVCKTNNIHDTLESAVQEAIKDLRYDLQWRYPRDTYSKPIVTKTVGGYLVTIITMEGCVYRRQIDVFTPANIVDSQHKFSYIMDKRIHTAVKPLHNWGIEDDNDEDEDDEEED